MAMGKDFPRSRIYTGKPGGQNAAKQINALKGARRVPDSLRFLLVLAVLAAVGYGAVWGLAAFPPEATEIVKPLPNSRFDE